jgi:hypothetical protein
MFLSVNVGVIDKIKKGLFASWIFRRNKRNYGENTNKMHDIFTWMETLSISLSFTYKNLILDSLFEEIWAF